MNSDVGNDVGNIEKQEMNLHYKKPKLKKYGTMKEFTFASSGSGGDTMGKSYVNDSTQDANDTQQDRISSNNSRGDSSGGNFPFDSGGPFNPKDPNNQPGSV